ncbi:MULTISPECIES: cbb3-type cytochrome oxidase assembly protein CcoS [Kaistella]|jgi:cbb3-type cytochrome oxidase maturation protein|uniref:Cbb3-type cytochrome oxidase assembly protein CcoS n=1 Tax=Kaistella pullorum TaxID=2763074 RepID=A0ABR8WJY7_9FLAO|nr:MULTISPECIES: cbb3-type cytochrome oxidase assembly protein CcoS [Kaistella]MBD8017203.1 cbb3-type cytochrome oxidase assembly protein CcoS [Kaistella pullorum]
MDILYLMILCSVSVAVIFLIIFIVSARKGQFEDDESPAVRILLDNEVVKNEPETSNETEQKNKKTDEISE